MILKDSVGLRRNRGAIGNIGSIPKHSQDIFLESNQGIKDRNEKDLREYEEERKAKRNKTNLEKKVELYNKIKNGEISSENVKNAGFLVDFEQTIQNDSNDFNEDSQNSNKNGERNSIDNCTIDDNDSNDEIEIQDEFGRSVFVLKKSMEYKEYQTKLKNEQNEAIRQQQQDEDENNYNKDDFNQYGRQHSSSSGSGDGGKSETLWPVSSGRDREDCGEWDPTLVKKGIKQGRGLKDFYESKNSSDDDVSKSGGGINGRVKSKWEFTLSSTEKAYLKDISEETNASRLRAAAAAASSKPLGNSGHHQEEGQRPPSSTSDEQIQRTGDSSEQSHTLCSSSSSSSMKQSSRKDVKAERREKLRKKREDREKSSSK
eukprot:CAMPEP_0114356594 /NCGR_PEP_ID=MMETSP0101-20121206/21073_1 /TAXON_ID=38822 ORGANISM="Pteridomonas danica, Strain PT" /NCGR_SAMPLE_ID=MMETSP0101 /ASSEMBLY_ACC=CAM_ASM_000211 /LENGTH=372 /DNA_ID=CAMNT_0001499093 /DNA_START=162 /DNA_END=1280 /DNA_ORIENTATION=+